MLDARGAVTFTETGWSKPPPFSPQTGRRRVIFFFGHTKLWIYSPSPPRLSAGEKVPKADEGLGDRASSPGAKTRPLSPAPPPPLCSDGFAPSSLANRRRNWRGESKPQRVAMASIVRIGSCRSVL